jgi:hypothetical protein
MTSNSIYEIQLKHRLDMLDDQETLFGAKEMKALLGERYSAYKEAVSVELYAEPVVSENALNWWRDAQTLLREVTDALNLGHVTTEGADRAQTKRAETFQSRAEELMRIYGNSIEGTPDASAFTVYDNTLELEFDAPYVRAHTLIEHWVLPMLLDRSAGIDPREYQRHMQRQFVQQELDELQRSTSGVGRQPSSGQAPTPLRELLRKRAKLCEF